MKKYKIIYADPAWVYNECGRGAATNHYNCSTVDEMSRIEIPADKDSICLMWVTYPQLNNGLKLMELWGFEFRTVAFTWVKTNKDGSFFMGMGRYTRANPEICLLGKKGKGVKRVSASVPNLQVHKRGRHSEKPKIIKEMIVKLFGDVPRIELFSRDNIIGWDAWGNEVPNHVQRTLI